MGSRSSSRQQDSFTTTLLSSFLAFAVSLSVICRQERCCQRVPQTGRGRRRNIVCLVVRLLVTVSLDIDILDIPHCLERFDRSKTGPGGARSRRFSASNNWSCYYRLTFSDLKYKYILKLAFQN